MFTSELWNGKKTDSYTIDQSIRFNPADTPYMHKTYSGAGDRTAWTFSTWFKLGDCNSMITGSNLYYHLFACDSAANDAGRGILTINNETYGGDVKQMQLQFQAHGTIFLVTNRQFRDPSSWYHLTLVWDSDNGTAGDRCRLYINGVRETSFATQNNPTSGQEIGINLAAKHTIGAGTNIATSGIIYHFDGYMAETVFLDGTATTASSFGETNSNGIWVPTDVSGLTFGTNGFWIDGRDSADLGDDESGQGNDFTTSGLAAHDQVADSPTNNFCVMNSIYADNSGTNSLTNTEGNLKLAGTSAGFDFLATTFNLPKSGKWYYEYTIGGGYDGFGFFIEGEGGTAGGANGLGQLSASQGGGIQYSGWRNGGNFTTNFGSTFTSGHIHQVAIDVDNGKFYYGIQNTYYATDAGTDGDPSAGTNELLAFAFATNDIVLAHMVATDSNAEHFNFGQNGTFNGTQTAQGNADANGIGNFYYAVPTNYLALCSKNVGG